MNQPDILFIAHRGESHDAPENTLAAVNLAWERNDDGVEIDIRMSKDGVVIVFHDDTTKRITGVKKKVQEQTFEKLRRLDAGLHKGEKWAQERIPAFEEILETVPPGRKLFVEIKSGDEILPGLEVILKKSPIYPDQVILMGFDLQIVAKARTVFPGYLCYWIIDLKKHTMFTSDVYSLIAQARQAGADGLNVSASGTINRTFTDAVKESGMGFYVWTVNDPADAQYFILAGVEGIMSDRAQWLRENLTL